MTVHDFLMTAPGEVRSDLRAVISYALDAVETRCGVELTDDHYLTTVAHFRSMLQSIPTDGESAV